MIYFLCKIIFALNPQTINVTNFSANIFCTKSIDKLRYKFWYKFIFALNPQVIKEVNLSENLFLHYIKNFTEAPMPLLEVQQWSPKIQSGCRNSGGRWWQKYLVKLNNHQW